MRYFDTSILVPLFIEERATAETRQLLKRLGSRELATSQWTRVEFSSLLARDVRMGLIQPLQATEIDAQFESLVTRAFTLIVPNADDYALSKQYLQRYETKLRAGDAFHLAAASNHGVAGIYSLDHEMVRAGKRLGLPMKP